MERKSVFIRLVVVFVNDASSLKVTVCGFMCRRPEDEVRR